MILCFVFVKKHTAIPSVLIATSRMDAGAITVHSNTATNIEVEASYLKALFDLSAKNNETARTLSSGKLAALSESI